MHPQADANRADKEEQAVVEQVHNDVEVRHHAELVIDGVEEFVHGAARVVRLAPRVREQFDGGDVGVGVGHAAGHGRARVRLRFRHLAQARQVVAQNQRVDDDPGNHQEHHRPVLARHQRDDGEEIGDDVHHDVGAGGGDRPHCQRRLHHFGGNAAGEFVLVEAHALPEQVVVHAPARRHRHVAHNHLVTRDGTDVIEKWQQYQHHQPHAGEFPAFVAQEGVGGARRQPIDDVADEAKEQHFQHGNGDAGNHDDPQRCVKAAAVVADEGEKRLRWRFRPVGREGVGAFLEGGVHDGYADGWKGGGLYRKRRLLFGGSDTVCHNRKRPLARPFEC